MNPFILIGVITLLMVLLALLSLWQRRIEEFQRELLVADIAEAEERGTTTAIAQYPQIDVQACIGCGSCVDACPEDGVLGLVDGVARVIHGARCIGHARCAAACPVAAITVGLGDVALRSDIPLLSERLETSVPGVYMAGELGGFALIRIAVEQGTRAIAEIARDLEESPRDRSSDIFDVLVVGAGPAGIAATLEAKRRKLSSLTIDQEDIGGTVRKYPRRKLTIVGQLNLPLYGLVKREEFIKEDLIRFWEEIIEEHALPIETGVKFAGIESGPDHFVAQTSHGPIYARRILLALGRRGTPRKLGVPGEDHEKVLYQLIDTATFNHEHILIVGGGDTAVEAATGLANQTGNQVTLSYRRNAFFRLKARNEERIHDYVRRRKLRVLFDSDVETIVPDSVVLNHRLEGGDKKVNIQNDYVFVFAGGEPPYPLLEGMGVRFGGDSERSVDEKTGFDISMS